jgi:hypothetical protein
MAPNGPPPANAKAILGEVFELAFIGTKCRLPHRENLLQRNRHQSCCTEQPPDRNSQKKSATALFSDLTQATVDHEGFVTVSVSLTLAVLRAGAARLVAGLATAAFLATALGAGVFASTAADLGLPADAVAGALLRGAFADNF